MNPLTHVHVTKRLIDEHQLDVDEDLIILGSVIPDLGCLRAIDYKKAHEDSLGFVHYLKEKDPEMISLAYGMMLHGEKPNGVDKYTHEVQGFIDQNEMEMYDIVKRYRHRLQGEELKSFIHTLIEWACDSFLTTKEANLLNRAFRKTDTDRIIYHLANYFHGDGKKLKRAFSFFKRFDFRKLTYVKGVAKTWDKFNFYQNLAEHRGFNVMRDLGTAWSLVRHNNTKKILTDARRHLKTVYPQYLEFLHEELSEHLVPHLPSRKLTTKLTH